MELEHSVSLLDESEGCGSMARFRDFLLHYRLWKSLHLFYHFSPCSTPLTLCFYASNLLYLVSLSACSELPQKGLFPYLHSSFQISSEFLIPTHFLSKTFLVLPGNYSSFAFSYLPCELEFSLHLCITSQFLFLPLFQSLF